MKAPLSLSFNNLEELKIYKHTHANLGLDPAFVEILWDNFCHLDPHVILDLLSPFDCDTSLHVMATAIADRPLADFQRVLRNLREHVRVLKPARVSDHLARFTVDGLRMIIPVEHTYTDVRQVAHRVGLYQDAIEMPLLMENYGSTTEVGVFQVDFFDALSSLTGCGVLFDVSNAVVAELNGCLGTYAWLTYLKGKSVHCHMGSYRFNPRTGMYHDTHNESPSPESLELLRLLADQGSVESLCYERDYDKTPANAEDDLSLIAAALGLEEKSGAVLTGDGHEYRRCA